MNATTIGGAVSIARNAPCACGSGRRYKACHGHVSIRCRDEDEVVARTMYASLEAQRARRLDEAREGYESVLAARPDTADALNMLGVIDLEQGDLASALRRLRRAVALFDGAFPDALHNLACALSARLVRDETERTEALWLETIAAASPPRDPSPAGVRISVVVPSHNHAAFVEDALASVLAQDRPPDEIVVIDDGSSDDSVARIEALARRHPGRFRFVARECRGAAATINEAVALSNGDWVNVLNSDDRFAPDRLARMADAIASRRDGWGFSRCGFIDEDTRAIDASSRLDVPAYRAMVDSVGACDTVGYAFLACNPAISTGALFFARGLFDRLGGFRDLRYNHDWDFCLRATRLAEPIFVPAPLYDYRVHGGNTIHASFERRKDEADRMFIGYYRDAFASGPPDNRYAPSPHGWGLLFTIRAIERGHASLLPPGMIEALADGLIAQDVEERDER